MGSPRVMRVMASGWNVRSSYDTTEGVRNALEVGLQGNRNVRIIVEKT
jgi:hypothetical protein